MSTPLESIRNIGIIAHIDAGKTTTTERILFYTGTTHRMGDVDEGTTTTDFDPEEAERGITIYSAAVTCHWQGTQINIIDTPGHVDFTAEVERSLRVLDGGVVIFSAVEGVEAQSETVWRQADKYGVPRICFINKMDRIGAGFERTFAEIGRRLQARPVALSIPIGAGSPPDPNALRGIVDLIEMQALYFDADSQGATIRREPIPDEWADAAQQWRAKLLDTLSLLDDDLMEACLESGDIPAELIHSVLRKATLARQLQPTLCGASLDYIGVQPLLDAIVRYLPHPLDRPPVEGEGTNPKKPGREIRKPSEKDPLAALVFKIVVDAHADLYFVRIYSGILESGSRVLDSRTGKKEFATQLWRVQADSRVKLEQAGPGEIVGLVGPRDAVTGDTLCDPQHPILLESIVFPETVISMAVEPESNAERKKLEETLSRLAKQDPTFHAQVSEETGQTIISGMGELHLEILRNRMLKDFGLKVRVHKPRVSYRETIGKAVEAWGEFDRTAGSVTQFARVKVRIEPYDGPEPIVVLSRIAPGTLPNELARLAEQTLKDEARGGGMLGYPLMKVRLTLLEAQTRETQTTDVAIQAATAMAFRQALNDSGVVLLEPVMRLEVVTPEAFLGNIQSDLHGRRAIIVNSDLRGDLRVLEAHVALSQMFGYSTQVRSLSQGRASYSMEPLNYAPAPQSVLDEMLG